MIERWTLGKVLQEIVPDPAGEDAWNWGREYERLVLDEDEMHYTEALAASLRLYGQMEPIVVRSDGLLHDGHRRVVAAMFLNLPSLLVNVIDRSTVIADLVEIVKSDNPALRSSQSSGAALTLKPSSG